MKCRKCGGELPESARFCPACGSPVEGVPAPRKLEEPIEPLAGGAVPLVPVAPPPRASRVTPRIPRPYVPRSSQRSSRGTAAGGHGSPYAATRREPPAQGRDWADLEREGRALMDEFEARRETPPQQTAGETPAPADARAEVSANEARAEKDAGEGDAPAQPAAGTDEGADVPEAEPEGEPQLEPQQEPQPEADSGAAPSDGAPEEPHAEIVSEDAPGDVVEDPKDGAGEDAVAADDAAVEPPAGETGSMRPAPEGEVAPAVAPEAAPDAAANAAPAPTIASGGSPLLRRARRSARRLSRAARRRLGSLGPNALPTVLVALLVVVVVGSVLAYVSTSWFSPFADHSSQAQEFEEQSDGSIEPIQADEGEDAKEEEESLVAGGPEVRLTLQAYTWEELSQISELIAEAPTDAEGLKIAALYNLCEEDGTLDPGNTKDLELADGTAVPVAVGGIRHDEMSDGSGAAGISFLTLGSVGNQPVDPSGIATPWEDTPLRSWLNQSLMAELPSELAELVVAVDKATNLPVAYGGGQGVTSELLWVPSYSEVVGPLDATTRRYGIYESEGEQYRLYEDAGVTCSTASSALLAIGEYWWTRSPDVVTDYHYLVVSPEGGTPYGHRTGTNDAVVIGFCL